MNKDERQKNSALSLSDQLDSSVPVQLHPPHQLPSSADRIGHLLQHEFCIILSSTSFYDAAGAAKAAKSYSFQVLWGDRTMSVYNTSAYNTKNWESLINKKLQVFEIDIGRSSTPSLKHIIAYIKHPRLTNLRRGSGEELRVDMATVTFNLLEHISRDNPTVHSIAVGDADIPICYSVGKELKVYTTGSDATGASAIIHAYSNAILLEALEPHISILPPNWTSSNSNTNRREGVRVRRSTPQAQVLVQLRPGDQFIISSRRFSLTISEPDPARFTPSVSEHSTVVDLEQDEVDNANTGLPLQGNGNTDLTSASTSHPSLPGDEIDMLGSPNVVASHDPDVVLSSSESKQSDADFGLLQTSTTGGPPQNSTESVDRVDQNAVVIGNKISATRIAGEQRQNHLAREDELQEQNSGPHADEASSVESNEGAPEQDSTLVEWEAAKLANEVVSPGIGTSPEGNQTEEEALPIDATSLALIQSKGETSPAPSATEVTHPRIVLVPPIPGEDTLLRKDVVTSSVLTHLEAEAMPEVQNIQQTVNEQLPDTAQVSSDVQATEHHDAHPVNGSTLPSSPKISTPSSEAVLVANSAAQSTFRPASAQASNVALQAQDDVDTQTSTIARIDGIFQLAGIDSDLTNSGSSPGKVTMVTDIETHSKVKRPFIPRTNLAAVGEETTESDGEFDSPTPASFPARGRPRVVQPSKLQGAAKRKLKSLERDASPRLKTPAKRRKTQETESSMESTIEVRPRSSRRKTMTSSQTSKRESRGVSALSKEPSFSSPSHKVAQSQVTSTESYAGPPPRVLFSSNSTVDEKAHLMSFFTRQGGRQVKTVKDCTILCVGPGELKKTSKLLLAVASGKDIVRDKWLVDSAKQRRLLDPSPYFAEDPDREVEWGTKLGDAIARGKTGTKPFADWAIWFTPTLKRELGSGFQELKEVALLAGADAVYAKLPPKGADPEANMLILASPNDRDAQTLAEADWTCYSKDVISLSVLQGRLNTQGFKLDLRPSAAEVKSGGKRKKR